jgi:hypothetical protein
VELASTCNDDFDLSSRGATPRRAGASSGCRRRRSPRARSRARSRAA